jgi:hypothetical protein
MDILTALNILQLNTYNFNSTELKKAYLKQALLCHPDKSGNTPYNTSRFQKVKESYDLLMLYVDKTEDTSSNNNNTTRSKNNQQYSQNDIHKLPISPEILYMFINNVLCGKYLNYVIDIVLGVSDLTALVYDDEISIETINKIKHFVKKYKVGDTQSRSLPTDNIPCSNASSSSSSTKEEEEDIPIDIVTNYTLHPSIDDLLDDNIYKLNINNSIFLVPLWHHECVYENIDGSEITVSCIPKSPNNIYIDDKNHIYTSISISLNSALLNEKYYINIGKKKYTLPIHELHIHTNQQQICLYNCGILEMNELDLINNTDTPLIRSNIYITVTLV